MNEPSLPTGPRARILLRLFWEFFRIAAFVLGGGYAILAAADDVFTRRLKWLREGELVDALPVFQMVPGLIAGNTAIYVGRKAAGLAGSAVSLVAVALPSLCVILAVAAGYDALPMESARLQGAFLGLRSALAGICAAMLVSTWPRIMRGHGAYPPVALAAGLALTLGFGAPPAWILLGGMAFGIAREALGGGEGAKGTEGTKGTAATAPERRGEEGGGTKTNGGEKVLRGLGWPAVAAAAVCAVRPSIFLLFAKFGLLCFGGGYVLVPVYLADFVGPDAPLLQLAPEEFGNFLAITQATPGPISVNAATFFGYRLGGPIGGAIATAGLLAPSFFLLTVALRSLDKWRRSAFVRGLLSGVAPMTVCLVAAAVWIFSKMSFLPVSPLQLRPASFAVAVFAFAALRRKKLGVMALVVAGAALGAAFPAALASALPR